MLALAGHVHDLLNYLVKALQFCRGGSSVSCSLCSAACQVAQGDPLCRSLPVRREGHALRAPGDHVGMEQAEGSSSPRIPNLSCVCKGLVLAAM